MTRYRAAISVAVLVFAAVALILLLWPVPMLMAVWPLLVIGSTVHDLLEGPWEPLALVNLIFSIAVLVAYGYGARWLWRRI